MDINRKPLSFSSLSFRERKPTKLKRETSHRISAFDTETYKGTAKLICASDGTYVLDADALQMLEFMTSNRFRQAHVFAYNLRFDAQALLKLLPNKNIREISSDGSTEYQGYKLKYIPSKLLTISDDNKHTSRMYDLAQFFEMSLDSAGEKFLGQRKIDFPFRAEMNTDIHIWKQYESDIIRYCQQDAALTAALGVFLDTKFYEKFHVHAPAYISKGNLGKYLVRKNTNIPDIRDIPKAAMAAAFYAYKGGRFEAIEKGAFEHCELYDIVSAYPYEIRELIDCTKGKWKRCNQMHEEAYYGFYVCRITVPYQRICPIAYVALQNFLYCPFGQWAAYLTKQEVEAYAPYADIEVVTGWEFIPSEIVKPFEEHITRLFEEKKKTPKEDYAYDLVKKMMNSIYGAFYEKTKGGEIIQTGVLFNPVYASIITANTRIKLFLFAKKYEKDVVALATDSVMLKGQHSVETSKDLGGWGLDGSGKTVVLMNGIYEMASKVKNRGIMSKTGQNSAKGLKTPYGVHQNIFEYMRACPGLTEYPYYSDKPVQMKEAIKSRERFTIADVNTWQIFEKSLKIDTDLKRIFTETFGNGGNYFKKCIGSEPRVVKP